MITKEIILQCVCDTLKVNISDVLKDRHEPGAKNEEIVYARQLCMTLAREWKLGSLSAIGKYYGGRDHVTVMNSEKTIKNELDLYPNKKLIFLNVHLMILHEVTKNIKKNLHKRIELELKLFTIKAQKICDSILKDMEEKTDCIEKMLEN